MTHTEWMIEAERLLNAMEQLDYKSDMYLKYRAKLKAHLAAKPDVEEDEDEIEPSAWTMSGHGEL